LEPLELAEIVHLLFAEFDKAVLARGLFKMDTVAILHVNPLPRLYSMHRNTSIQLQNLHASGTFSGKDSEINFF
jgi:hypothetical protein